MLITYCAGPVPSDEQTKAMDSWVRGGGKWLCLHGSVGGKALKPIEGELGMRRIAKLPFHDLVGCCFRSHPPHRRFDVQAVSRSALTAGVPDTFSVVDEPYVIELLDPNAEILLTTQMTDDEARALRADGTNYGFKYGSHPALEGPDGTTMCLGYRRDVGAGGVVYIALGHCHGPEQWGSRRGGQPYVHESANPGGTPKGPPGHVETAKEFPGEWAGSSYPALLKNAVHWGLGAEPESRL